MSIWLPEGNENKICVPFLVTALPEDETIVVGHNGIEKYLKDGVSDKKMKLNALKNSSPSVNPHKAKALVNFVQVVGVSAGCKISLDMLHRYAGGRNQPP